MCCYFQVYADGEEQYVANFVGYGPRDTWGHEADPLLFMKPPKSAVGYANTLLYEGHEKVHIIQAPDPCMERTVYPPFDLSEFCTEAIKRAEEEARSWH